MSAEDYQHACERAELLGLPRPSEDEWRQSQAAQNESHRRGDDDDDDDGALQDLDYADETAGRVGGGLDELNSILSTTQKKLNRFKTVCGSLGTLLKARVNPRGGTPRRRPGEPSAGAGEQESQKKPEESDEQVMTVETSDDITVTDASQSEAANVQPRQIDLSQKMGSHLDKLDSLITKAENAQYSMQHQTKQMKKFLKK